MINNLVCEIKLGRRNRLEKKNIIWRQFQYKSIVDIASALSFIIRIFFLSLFFFQPIYLMAVSEPSENEGYNSKFFSQITDPDSIYNLSLEKAREMQLDVALIGFVRAAAIYRHNDSLFKFAKSIDNAGRCFAMMGYYQKAMDYYSKSYKIFHSLQDRPALTNNTIQRCLALQYMGKQPKAIEEYYGILPGLDTPYDSAVVFNNLGNCLNEIGEKTKALSALKNSYLVCTKNNIPKPEILTSLSAIFIELKQFDSSLYYLSLAGSYDNLTPEYYINLALSHQYLSNIDSAYYYAFSAMALAEENLSRDLTAYCFFTLASIHSFNNHTDSAIIYANKSAAYYHEIENFRELSNIYDFLADMYEKENMPDSVLSARKSREIFLAKSKLISDEIDKSRMRGLTDLEMRIDTMNLEIDKVYAGAGNVFNIILILIIAGIAVLVILYFIYRKYASSINRPAK